MQHGPVILAGNPALLFGGDCRGLSSWTASVHSAFKTSQSKRPIFSWVALDRMRPAAARACSRLTPPLLGISRATGLPCRVMTISSPCSTRSSKEPRVFLASKAPRTLPPMTR